MGDWQDHLWGGGLVHASSAHLSLGSECALRVDTGEMLSVWCMDEIGENRTQGNVVQLSRDGVWMPGERFPGRSTHNLCHNINSFITITSSGEVNREYEERDMLS